MIAEVIELEDGSKTFRTLAGAQGDGLPLGTIIGIHRTAVPTGFLPCNGQEFDINQYPSLYTLLGSNKLPDLREATLVGIGASERSSIAQHDVYALGQFKDDQLQTLNMTVDTSGIEVQINDPGHSHAITQDASIGTIDVGDNYNGTGEAVFKGAVKNGTNPVSITGGEVATEESTTGITAEIADGSITTTIEEYRHGTTTHGKQYGINYVIKATTGTIDVNDAEIYADVIAFLDENYIKDDIINLVNGDLIKYDGEKYVAIERPEVNGYVLSAVLSDATVRYFFNDKYFKLVNGKYVESTAGRGTPTTKAYVNETGFDHFYLGDDGEMYVVYNGGDIVYHVAGWEEEGTILIPIREPVAVEPEVVGAFIDISKLSYGENTDYEWVPNGSVAIHSFATEAEYNSALAITEGNPGYIRDGDIVLKEWITDVLTGAEYESV